MNPGNTALLLVGVLLLATKALDVHSTWQHVGVEGELNPLARRWFRRFGLARGLCLVCAVYLLVLAIEFALVWWLDHSLLTWGTVLLGLFIAWAQWDVARFNCTRRHSWFTRRMFVACSAWDRRLRRIARRD